jgi:gliding motility-associated-like protein
MKSIFTLIFIILSLSSFAQYFKNPSLEGAPGVGTMPGDWYIDREGGVIPVVVGPWPFFPPPFEIKRHAYSGNTYVVISRRSAANMGIFGQELAVPLDSGKTYTFTFQIAADEYESKAVGIMGKNTTDPNEQGEVLWTSITYYDTDWRRVRAYITPSRKTKVLTFFPYRPESEKTARMILSVDNFSEIRKTFKLDMTADYLCSPSDTGSATALASGSQVFTYYWEPGGYTTPTISGLSAGRYKVTVTDDNGIERNDSVDVKMANVTTGISTYPISCYGKNDGYIQILADGGQSPYTFTLNNTIIQDSSIFYHLSPGDYTINIKDRNGCDGAEKYTTIENIDSLILESIEVNPISCNSAIDGQIILNVTGGTPPYLYSILNNTPQVENIFQDLDQGSYNYKIDDRHHCIIEGNATITKEYRTCAVYVPSAFSPNGDGLNDVFRIRLQERVTAYRMAVYGRWGEILFESNDPYAGWDGKLKGVAIPAGNYTWMATYTDIKKQLIKQQGSLTLIK